MRRCVDPQPTADNASSKDIRPVGSGSTRLTTAWDLGSIVGHVSSSRPSRWLSAALCGFVKSNNGKVLPGVEPDVVAPASPRPASSDSRPTVSSPPRPIARERRGDSEVVAWIEKGRCRNEQSKRAGTEWRSRHSASCQVQDTTQMYAHARPLRHAMLKTECAEQFSRFNDFLRVSFLQRVCNAVTQYCSAQLCSGGGRLGYCFSGRPSTP